MPNGDEPWGGDVIVLAIWKGLGFGALVDCWANGLNAGIVGLSAWVPRVLGGSSTFEFSSSLRKSDSSSLLVGGEAAGVDSHSSTIPFARACEVVRPLMTAGSVLPNRLHSTRFCEKICFRRGFESVYYVRSISHLESSVTDLPVFSQPPSLNQERNSHPHVHRP